MPRVLRFRLAPGGSARCETSLRTASDVEYRISWQTRGKHGRCGMAEDHFDVIVVGAGNAGLCAALAAREANARVLLLEKGPKPSRGGNTRFAGGGFRFIYQGVDDIRPMVPEVTDQEASRLEVGSYTAADYFEDIMQVTEYAADKALSRKLVDESASTVRWLTAMK